MRFYILLLISTLFLGLGACKKHGSCDRKAKNSLLHSVTESTPLSIKNTWTGCFAGGTETITITKAGKGYEFTLTEIDGKKRSGPFTKAAQNQYEILESKGKAWNGGNGCTTISDYTITAGQKTISFTDGSCGFDEYYKLKEKL